MPKTTKKELQAEIKSLKSEVKELNEKLEQSDEDWNRMFDEKSEMWRKMDAYKSFAGEMLKRSQFYAAIIAQVVPGDIDPPDIMVPIPQSIAEELLGDSNDRFSVHIQTYDAGR